MSETAGKKKAAGEASATPEKPTAPSADAPETTTTESDETPTAGGDAAETTGGDAPSAAAEEEAPKIDRDRLIAEADDFLGHPPHVVAGALANERRKSFTLDETKDLIRDFLKRPVEVDNGEEG